MLQELGIPCTMMSVSELNISYREFLHENHGDLIEHMYTSFQDQVDEACCLLHPKSQSCKGCGSAGRFADVAILGTPCPPFSTQRCKRYSQGSVKNHHDFNLTFKTTYDLLLQHNPRVVVFEQVEGFDLPFACDDPTTPKTRLGCADLFHTYGTYCKWHMTNMLPQNPSRFCNRVNRECWHLAVASYLVDSRF